MAWRARAIDLAGKTRLEDGRLATEDDGIAQRLAAIKAEIRGRREEHAVDRLAVAMGSEIAKLVPDDLKMTLKKALQQSPDLREKVESEPQVKDLIDGVYGVEDAQAALAAQDGARYEAMGEKQVAKEIKRLEKEMLEHARNLEFEKAARLRDQLAQLREQAFGARVHDNVVPLDAARKGAAGR